MKTILSSIRFLTRQEISLWPKRLKSGPKRIKKNPLKTHIEALKIQKKSRGRLPPPPNERGIIPLSCSPPLVPSTLDGFFRRTTFKYAATALHWTFSRVSPGKLFLDFELKKVLLPPPREFCRHILSWRKFQAASFKRCLHFVLRGVSLWQPVTYVTVTN